MKKLLPEKFELDRYGLHCRLVNEEDAEFIVAIRTDEKLARFIHPTDADVQQQMEWIREYKQREAEGTDYYYMFLKDGVRQGVARIYNIHDEDFTSGSWVFAQNAVKGSAILGDIISRELAFEQHPQAINFFDVRKDNITVQRYAHSYHPTILVEDEQNVFYSVTRDNFEKYKHLYIRLANR